MICMIVVGFKLIQGLFYITKILIIFYLLNWIEIAFMQWKILYEGNQFE